MQRWSCYPREGRAAGESVLFTQKRKKENPHPICLHEKSVLQLHVINSQGPSPGMNKSLNLKAEILHSTMQLGTICN